MTIGLPAARIAFSDGIVTAFGATALAGAATSPVISLPCK